MSKSKKQNQLSNRLSTIIIDADDRAIIHGTINDIVLVNTMIRMFELAKIELPAEMVEKTRKWIQE